MSLRCLRGTATSRPGWVKVEDDLIRVRKEDEQDELERLPLLTGRRGVH